MSPRKSSGRGSGEGSRRPKQAQAGLPGTSEKTDQKSIEKAFLPRDKSTDILWDSPSRNMPAPGHRQLQYVAGWDPVSANALPGPRCEMAGRSYALALRAEKPRHHVPGGTTGRQWPTEEKSADGRAPRAHANSWLAAAVAVSPGRITDD